MNRQRRVALVLVLVSGAVLLASTIAMAFRVAEYNRTSDRELYYFQRIGDRQFSYDGLAVSIHDERDASGEEVVRVVYGDQEITLRPTFAPGPHQMPGLERHMEWMQVLRFAPAGEGYGKALQERIDRNEVDDRLAIVTRAVRPGADPDTWGEVWRKDWTFDFYEFLPGGGFEHEHLAFPRTRRHQDAAPGELVEGTWQFQASLLVMPKGAGPKLKFKDDAVSAMGWTFPVASVAALVLAFAVGWLVFRPANSPAVSSSNADES